MMSLRKFSSSFLTKVSSQNAISSSSSLNTGLMNQQQQQQQQQQYSTPQNYSMPAPPQCARLPSVLEQHASCLLPHSLTHHPLHQGPRLFRSSLCATSSCLQLQPRRRGTCCICTLLQSEMMLFLSARSRCCCCRVFFLQNHAVDTTTQIAQVAAPSAFPSGGGSQVTATVP